MEKCRKRKWRRLANAALVSLLMTAGLTQNAHAASCADYKTATWKIFQGIGQNDPKLFDLFTDNGQWENPGYTNMLVVTVDELKARRASGNSDEGESAFPQGNRVNLLYPMLCEGNRLVILASASNLVRGGNTLIERFMFFFDFDPSSARLNRGIEYKVIFRGEPKTPVPPKD